MKKLLAILLSVIIVFTVATPAFAGFGTGKWLTTKVPMIVLAGDGNKLVYDNETKAFDINDMLSIYKNSEDGSFKEAAFNILYPLILKGIAFDDWDDYYDAVYKEISDVYKPIMLDENGNVTNDSGISTAQKQDMQSCMTWSRANPDGSFNEETYEFFYDWRLDPCQVADQLHEYIEGVKRATGCEKVELASRCLGSNIVLAYISKYGSASVKGLGIDVSTTNGANFLGGMLSGEFGVDGSGLSRIATDLIYADEDYKAYREITDFATSTVNMLESAGVLDRLSKTAVDLLYSKIEYGIISALALSTFMTFPGYWAMINADYFDKALNYVFGPEGSEKRVQYKVLIEKITAYNDNVKKNAYPLLKAVSDSNVNICIISKYGVQMVPFVKDSSILGDEYVSVEYSSFGATTGTVYEDLSDEYIEQRVAAGYGRYISPDKKVDASTCLFPDYTWFVKGAQHARYTHEEVEILLRVIDADRQLTIDDFDWTQFIVFDEETGVSAPMTTENCNTERWKAEQEIDNPSTDKERLTAFLVTLIRWMTSLLRLLTSRLSKQ